MKTSAGSWSGFAKTSSIGDKYLTWHVYILLGYALLGRSFAYLGLGPLFIGEITLVFGLLVWVLSRCPLKVFELLTAWFLIGFMLWGCIRTLPYLSRYGVDAMRDAAVWGYGTFAFIVATLLIAKPERLRVLIDRYRRFCLLFVALIPVVILLVLLSGGGDRAGEILPRMPGALLPEPIVQYKAGDVMVHVAGITAFVVSGLGTIPLFATGMTFVTFCLATTNRGGLLAFLASISLVLLMRPLSGRVWRLVAIGGFLIVVFAASGISISEGASEFGQSREISFEQIVTNLQSIFGDEESVSSSLQSNKQWRLDWWNEIIGYTFGGDYFWTGKGFGINLADEDGFQIVGGDSDGTLRSPHNGHLTMVARAGVPGLFLWLLTQLSWSLGMLGVYQHSRLKGERRWANLFLFLLAYWAAFMISAAFDVAFEGPMVGIWFWTIFGIGLAAMWIYRCHPEALVGNQRTAPRARPLPAAQSLPAARR